MRRVIVGLSVDGSSTVIDDGPPATIFGFNSGESQRDPHQRRAERLADVPPELDNGQVVVGELWMTSAPPITGVSDDPTKAITGWAVECPVGGTVWRLCAFGPHRMADAHTTQTLDYDIVIAGEVDLLLDDQEVHLVAGDVVVLPGVRHGWRAGPAGCTLGITMVALARGRDVS